MTLRAPLITRIPPTDRTAAINAIEGVRYNRLALTSGSPGPAQHDWPNPRRPWVVAQDAGRQSLALTTTASPPFAQRDWPNPRRSVPLVPDAGARPLTMVSGGGEPFYNRDWPNPRAAIRPPYDTTWRPAALYTVIASPFAQHDWPNPRQRPGALFDANQAGLSLFATLGVLPFSNYDWPNPRGYAPAMQDWQLQGAYTTYFPPPLPPPPYDSRADGIDRMTGTYIFPGANYLQREANVLGMLNGTVLVQTWKQLETLKIFIGGSLPAFYEPGALR